MRKIVEQSLNMLIRFWENSTDPWSVKDNQSRFIYANPRFNKVINLPVKYNVEGRLDGEMPSSVSEFQDQFQHQDRQVELLQDRITSVEIHLLDGLTYFTPYFCDKYPLIDEQGVSQGVICHARPVTNIMLTCLNKLNTPMSLMLTPPLEIFSKREWEVLFYILHPFSSTEIAKRLSLSSREICNVIQSIYKKAGVSNKQQIIEYCHENKIDNYVPQSFFENSGSFL